MFSAAREQAIWRIYVGTQAVVILLRDRGSCLTVPSLARSSLDLCPAPAFSPPGNHSCWDFTILSSSSGKPLCWRASCAGAWHSAPRWHTSFYCLEARDRLSRLSRRQTVHQCWKRLFRLRLRGTEKFIDLTFQCPAVWRSWSSCDHTSIVAPGTIRQVEGWGGRLKRAEKGRCSMLVKPQRLHYFPWQARPLPSQELSHSLKRSPFLVWPLEDFNTL